MNASGLATKRTRAALAGAGYTPVSETGNPPGGSPVARFRRDPTVLVVRTSMASGLPVTTVRVPTLPAGPQRGIAEPALIALRLLAMAHRAQLGVDAKGWPTIHWPSAHVPSWRHRVLAERDS